MTDRPVAVETIVAIATPPGRGGIGIVRLSGPQAVRVAEEVLRGGAAAEKARAPLEHGRAPLEHGRARLEQIAGDDGGVLDQVVVTAFLAPRSYTGEDVVEIAAHGSPVVLQAIVQRAMGAGARLARPGEFTQRAFLAGRLDLAQAEAVHDLIAAQTLDQARVAAQQMGGGLARRLGPAKERLLRLIALLEAGMDFASGELDDVDVVAVEEIAEAIAGVEAPLRELAAGYRQGMLQREGAALALVGVPNAGKSSLFNRLLERERAIVTAVPGTTRDTLEEAVVLRTPMGGVPVRVIDTAGLRLGFGMGEAAAGAAGVEESGEADEAVDEAEALGMARSREALAEADVVVMVHDASLAMGAAERAMLRELTGEAAAEGGAVGGGRPVVMVWNKIDLTETGGGLPEIEVAGGPVVRTSAKTGEGLDALRAAIVQALGAGGVGELAMVNNQRQHAALQEALTALAAGQTANAGGMPHEVVLLDLHAALRAVDSLTGVTTSEDVLARIFATFCIGK